MLLKEDCDVLSIDNQRYNKQNRIDDQRTNQELQKWNSDETIPLLGLTQFCFSEFMVVT